MKALSIKQPWAWLICAGYKDIENRNWRIGRNPRHGAYSSWDVANFTIELPQRIYVHAGKTPDINCADFIYARLTQTQISEYEIMSLRERRESYGAIIGEVTITGCVTESKSPWFEGKYGFTLSQPTLYNVPIPYKGKLGFFEVHLDEQSRGNQTGA